VPARFELRGQAAGERTLLVNLAKYEWAGAKGIDLGDDYVAQHGDFYASIPPDTKSSSGAVARFGDELGVPTPTHAIYSALKLAADGRPV
jgi:hypothetical protein